MLRHLVLVAITAVAIAACGSSGATPSPVASASGTPAVSASTAPGTPPPQASSSTAPSAGAGTMMTVACDLVGVRKSPTTKGAVEGRIHAGSVVRVVGTVTGDVYSAGSCGTGGTQWLKIDQVDGKGAKLVFGVDVVYAAAGFFR